MPPFPSCRARPCGRRIRPVPAPQARWSGTMPTSRGTDSHICVVHSWLLSWFGAIFRPGLEQVLDAFGVHPLEVRQRNPLKVARDRIPDGQAAVVAVDEETHALDAGAIAQRDAYHGVTRRLHQCPEI